MTKQTYLGTFDIGMELIELYATPTAGGEFISNPTPQIQIGILPNDWAFIYQTILHEVLEYASFRSQCRFNPDLDFSSDCGSFIFVMNHSQFSSICGRAALFMVEAVPAVYKAWSAYHRKRK